jgi:hypothetical protein
VGRASNHLERRFPRYSDRHHAGSNRHHRLRRRRHLGQHRRKHPDSYHRGRQLSPEQQNNLQPSVRGSSTHFRFAFRPSSTRRRMASARCRGPPTPSTTSPPTPGATRPPTPAQSSSTRLHPPRIDLDRELILLKEPRTVGSGAQCQRRSFPPWAVRQ